MSGAFKKEIIEGLDRFASLDEFTEILKRHRDGGLSQSTAELCLSSIRADSDEEVEDRLLEVLDLVSGWCGPELGVWVKENDG